MRRSGALARLSQLAAVLGIAAFALALPAPAVGDRAPRHHATTPSTTSTTSTTVPETTTTVPETTTTVAVQALVQAPAPEPVQQADPIGLGAQLAALGATPEVVSTFLCIVQRESRFDPGAVNPSSGAGGLFQFLPSTWYAIGRTGLPNLATVEEQVAAAWSLYTQQGFAPWGGGCS